jgi:hypothetical protein
MSPTQILQTRDGFLITHQCVKCGFIRNNKSSPHDDIKTIIAIVKEQAS